MAGKASVRGDFLDHVLDRYADVFMLGGIAFNATYCRLGVGTLALLGVLLTSYMGTQAQAVGQGRAYGGVLGRADRLVLLFFGGLIQLLVAPSGGLVAGVGILQFGPLEWFMVLFAVLGNATAVQRAVGIWRGLAAPRLALARTLAGGTQGESALLLRRMGHPPPPPDSDRGAGPRQASSSSSLDDQWLPGRGLRGGAGVYEACKSIIRFGTEPQVRDGWPYVAVDALSPRGRCSRPFTR